MMKQKTLYLMCGCPGSGKTTLVKKMMEQLPNCCHISRDEIRFSLLNDDDDYFAKEDEVFLTFINTINEKIKSEKIENIFINATHLNQKSRNLVLNKLDKDNYEIIPISFELPLDIHLKRNANREGRARVPDDVIKSMWNKYQIPTFNEKYKYNKIIHVNEKGELKYGYLADQ